MNFTLKSIAKHLHQKLSTKTCNSMWLVHRSTYVELNKTGFVIFGFIYELLRIYQFTADLENLKKNHH